MLFNLYKYELKKFKKIMMVFLSITLILNIYQGVKVVTGYSNTYTGMAVDMTLAMFTFLIPFFLSDHILVSKEYSDNTIYLMKSLPVSSKLTFLSKNLAGVSVYIVFSLFVGILGIIQMFIALKIDPKFADFHSIYLHIDGSTANKLFEIIMGLSCLYISSIVLFLTGINSVFLSSMIGKTFKKYSSLISMGSFLIILYLIGKFISATNTSEIINGTFTNSFLAASLGFDALFLVISAILFFGTCFVYDKKIGL